MNTKAESSETSVSEGAAMSMPAARENRAKADGDGDGDEHANRAKRVVRVERRSRADTGRAKKPRQSQQRRR